MIRDKYKNEQYFSVLIDQLIARAQKYEFRRDEFPKDSIQFEKCQIHLRGIYNDLIYALYSSGASFEEIKPYYDQAE